MGADESLRGDSGAFAWRPVGALVENHPAVVTEIMGSASISQRLAQQVLEAGLDGDPGMSVFTDPADRLAESYPGIMAEGGVLQPEGACIRPLNLCARARALDLIIERLSSTPDGHPKSPTCGHLKLLHLN